MMCLLFIHKVRLFDANHRLHFTLKFHMEAQRTQPQRNKIALYYSQSAYCSSDSGTSCATTKVNMIQGNTKGKVRQPVKDYECFQTHNTNTDGTFTLGLSLKKKNRTDQGHYRIFNFVIIKISRLIKSMFLFISLPEAPSPNCIHQS